MFRYCFDVGIDYSNSLILGGRFKPPQLWHLSNQLEVGQHFILQCGELHVHWFQSFWKVRMQNAILILSLCIYKKNPHKTDFVLR